MKNPKIDQIEKPELNKVSSQNLGQINNNLNVQSTSLTNNNVDFQNLLNSCDPKLMGGQQGFNLNTVAPNIPIKMDHQASNNGNENNLMFEHLNNIKDMCDFENLMGEANKNIDFNHIFSNDPNFIFNMHQQPSNNLLESLLLNGFCNMNNGQMNNNNNGNNQNLNNLNLDLNNINNSVNNNTTSNALNSNNNNNNQQNN